MISIQLLALIPWILGCLDKGLFKRGFVSISKRVGDFGIEGCDVVVLETGCYGRRLYLYVQGR